MGYTGHELDAEVGIVNAKGRLFDPKLGRFLQVDPLQTDLLNAQRWNGYSYGLNNPLRYTDPSGFDGEEAAPADLPNVSIGPRWDAHGQLDPGRMTEWHCTADGYSACVGMTVPVQPGGGASGTAQTGNAAEEASSPSAPGALEVAQAYAEGLAPSLGNAYVDGAKGIFWMAMGPVGVLVQGVQRAQGIVHAYDRDGWSGAFWKTVASMPVLGSISAAVDAYREAYALPMTDPRDRARAAGQITLPVAEAVVGVGVAAYGLAEGVGAAKGARVGAVLDESAKGTGNFGSTHKLTPDEALTAGERWIGSGYKEVGGSGTGVFRSANGIGQFRIDEGSITGAHGEVGPHVHFETLDPLRRGKEAILSNNHVPLE